MDISALEIQIEKTLEQLNNKYNEVKTKQIKDIIDEYTGVKCILMSNQSLAIKKRASRKLLNKARGYMEYDSDYSQQFLSEMGKTEQIITDWINTKIDPEVKKIL